MQTELVNHLEYEDTPNRKKDSNTKTVKPLSSSFELETPRDRDNTFDLQASPEHEIEPIYPIVWLSVIHYKIKMNDRYISKAVYIILGLNIKGKKEILGLYLSGQEDVHNGSVFSQIFTTAACMIF